MFSPSWVEHAEKEGYPGAWDATEVVKSGKISEHFLFELEKQLEKPHNMVPGINIRVVLENNGVDGSILRKAVTTAATGVKGKVQWFQSR